MKKLYLLSLLLVLMGCDTDGKSRVPLPVDPTPPELPTLVAPDNVAALSSVDEVTISWDASANASGYALYRCPLNPNTRQCDAEISACGDPILETSALSGADTSLGPTDIFCYGVEACDGDRCSELSAQVIGAGALGVPAQLQLHPSHATTVVEGQVVSLHVSTTGASGDVHHSWVQTGGPTVTLNNSTTAHPNFTSPAVSNATTVTFEVTATDNNGSTSKTVSVAVNDQGIFVDAGNSSFASTGQTVSLHGVGHGAGGSMDYSWQQVPGSGPSVSLNNANTSNPTFVVPVVTVSTDLIFELSFSDGVSSAKDRVTVSVPGPVHAPLPHAPLTPQGAFASTPLLVTSPQWLTVAELSSHDLSAFASGGDGNYTYHWASTGRTPNGAPLATLTNTNRQIAHVSLPDVTATTVYNFTVSATDSSGNSDSTIVQIEVDDTSASGPPLATLAVIAPNLVVSGGPIKAVLSASATGGTKPYAFSWVQATGPAVPLGGANTATARFFVPAGDPLLTFNVTVTDSLKATATREVKVLVHNPFAHTPPQVLRLQPLPDSQVLGGTDVTLAVGATGGDQNYSWSWKQTAGRTAAISGAGSNTATITPQTVTAQETLSFEVTVTDGLGSTVSETINLIVLPTASTQPLSFVSVPDMHIDEGLKDATIAGLAQGGTGNYTYDWQYNQSAQLDPTIKIALSDSDKSVTRFDMPGVSGKTILRFDLTIADGVTRITEKVFVVVNDLSATLSLGHLQDQRVHSGDTVHLNGATASGGVSPYTYKWTKTSGPTITLNDDTTVNPNFVAPVVTTSTPIVFTYIITDAANNTVTVGETVTVDPVIKPLSGSLGGPDEVAGGQDATFNAAVAGGVAPYTYTYSSTGVQIQFAPPATATANPTVTLPTVTTDTTATISLLVHDSATPQNSIKLTHTIKVTAPPAATGGPGPGFAAVCGDPHATPPTPCTLMELVLTQSTELTCPASSPYGMNDVFQYSDDQHVDQFRRCGTLKECDEQWWQGTSDKPLCTNFDSNIPVSDDLFCHFCCYSPPGAPACNTLDVPPSNTWYRP